MDLQGFLDRVGRHALIEGGSEAHRFLHDAAQEAFQVTARLNTGYRRGAGSRTPGVPPSARGRSSDTGAP